MMGVPGWVFAVAAVATAVGVLIQAAVMLGIGIGAFVAFKRVNQISKLAEQHVVPMLNTARDLLNETSPKVKVVTQNVVEITEKAKVQAAHASTAMDDLLKKTESQADRVDEMITGTLNSLSHATATMQKAVSIPVRQVGAVLHGLKVGLETLRTKERNGHDGVRHDVVDPEAFV